MVDKTPEELKIEQLEKDNADIKTVLKGVLKKQQEAQQVDETPPPATRAELEAEARAEQGNAKNSGGANMAKIIGIPIVIALIVCFIMVNVIVNPTGLTNQFNAQAKLITDATAQQKSMLQTINDNKAQVDTIANQIDAQNSKIDQLNSTVDGLNNNVADLSNEVGNFSDNSSDVNSLKNSIAQINSAYTELKNQVDALPTGFNPTQLAEINTKLDAINTALTGLGTRITALEVATNTSPTPTPTPTPTPSITSLNVVSALSPITFTGIGTTEKTIPKFGITITNGTAKEITYIQLQVKISSNYLLPVFTSGYPLLADSDITWDIEQTSTKVIVLTGELNVDMLPGDSLTYYTKLNVLADDDAKVGTAYSWTVTPSIIGSQGSIIQ